MKRFAPSLLVLLAACSGGGGDGNSSQAATGPAIAAPAGANWTETVTRTPEGGFRMGNPDAPVKLVEYGARTCPTCGAFSRAAATPLEQNYVASGRVSFEFRDFLVHGAPDLAAALVGQCAGAGPFFPIMNQMYAEQPALLDKLQAAIPALEARARSQTPAQQVSAIADAMGLVDFAKQRGVPEGQVRQCLADTAAMDRLTKSSSDAAAGGRVTGTPTFYVNDEPVPGAVSWPQVEEALKRAGA